MSKWIRKGDRVLVIAGNEKGHAGKVLARKGQRIAVESLNMRSKHLKKSQAHPEGGIVRIEAFMDVSNVALCNEQGEKIKVAVRQSDLGQRDLIYRKGDEEILFRTLKKGRGER